MRQHPAAERELRAGHPDRQREVMAGVLGGGSQAGRVGRLHLHPGDGQLPPEGHRYRDSSEQTLRNDSFLKRKWK